MASNLSIYGGHAIEQKWTTYWIHDLSKIFRCFPIRYQTISSGSIQRLASWRLLKFCRTISILVQQIPVILGAFCATVDEQSHSGLGLPSGKSHMYRVSHCHDYQRGVWNWRTIEGHQNLDGKNQSKLPALNQPTEKSWEIQIIWTLFRAGVSIWTKIGNVFPSKNRPLFGREWCLSHSLFDS
jgi:hypothetical protein